MNFSKCETGIANECVNNENWLNCVNQEFFLVLCVYFRKASVQGFKNVAEISWSAVCCISIPILSFIFVYLFIFRTLSWLFIQTELPSQVSSS